MSSSRKSEEEISSYSSKVLENAKKRIKEAYDILNRETNRVRNEPEIPVQKDCTYIRDKLNNDTTLTSRTNLTTDNIIFPAFGICSFKQLIRLQRLYLQTDPRLCHGISHINSKNKILKTKIAISSQKNNTTQQTRKLTRRERTGPIAIFVTGVALPKTIHITFREIENSENRVIRLLLVFCGVRVCSVFVRRKMSSSRNSEEEISSHSSKVLEDVNKHIKEAYDILNRGTNRARKEPETVEGSEEA
ncbi:hypothetical protein ACROYT_G044256 [Oculina patagonica]